LFTKIFELEKRRGFGPFSSRDSFTLIEVLLAGVVVTLASTAGWMSTSVLMKSHEVASNRSTATNLLQKSQEEIRPVDYDIIETCQFPPGNGSNACGLADISSTFPGFSRTLSVNTEAGSQELKEAVITVSWNEWGSVRQLQSVVLLSRPPQSSPGNIIGSISSSTDGSLIDKADVVVTYLGETHKTTSTNAPDSKGANFDFANPDTGGFVLPAGKWTLTATCDGFLRPQDQDIEVSAGKEEFVYVIMTPNPEASITAQLINATTGQDIPKFTNGIVRLCKDYTTEDKCQKVSSPTNALVEFSVTFSEENKPPQCFTLNTDNAYLVGTGYAGPPPSCIPNYRYKGWSSSIFLEDETLDCAHPWNGSTATDRICVSPGDKITVQVPLIPVPLATIKGRIIRNDTGQGIKGTVYVYWPKDPDPIHRNDSRVFRGSVVSDNDGYFIYSVPAAQEIFDDKATDQYLGVRASSKGPILDCCNVLSEETRYSSFVYPGPLKEGDIRDIGNLGIDVSQKVRDCGNAIGKITDDRTPTNLVAQAKVIISSPTTQTDSGGNYQFVCTEEPPYRLPGSSSGSSYEFKAQHPGYYEYTSKGNRWYGVSPNVIIKKNLTTTYNARLWPKGFGTLIVKVRDKATENPIAGANVKVTLYDGTLYTADTDTAGDHTFTPIIETWPPSDLPKNSYYKYETTGAHSLTVTHPSGIYLPFSQSIDSLVDGEELIITVYLQTRGNM
jgi:hypothetical protein